MGRLKRRRAGAAVALVGALLGGCVADGDFGRREASDAQQRFGLSGFASLPGYKHTSNNAVPLTAAETDLRGHAYSLVYAYAHEPTHDHWTRPDKVINSPLAVDRFPQPQVYARKLGHAGFAAPEARLNAIVDDIRADLVHIDAFQRAAQDVYADDGSRLVDMERLGLSRHTAKGVTQRIADNRYVVEQTLVALTQKIAGYDLALGEAFVAAPRTVGAAAQIEVEGIKRRFARLEADLRNADNRVALTMPREQQCLGGSIARPC